MVGDSSVAGRSSNLRLAKTPRGRSAYRRLFVLLPRPVIRTPARAPPIRRPTHTLPRAECATIEHRRHCLNSRRRSTAFRWRNRRPLRALRKQKPASMSAPSDGGGQDAPLEQRGRRMESLFDSQLKNAPHSSSVQLANTSPARSRSAERSPPTPREGPRVGPQARHCARGRHPGGVVATVGRRSQ